MNKDIRPALRKFVLGSLFSSVSFWCVALFLVLAIWKLVDLWRFTQRTHVLGGSFQQLLLMAAFLLAIGTYVFFSNLLRLRKAAQAEADEERQALIVSGVDLALKMFYFGVASLAFGFGLCLMVLHK
ncbi:MAG: hypothetical protein WCD43_17945 [Candidatus Acidiferrales bacterium]